MPDAVWLAIASGSGSALLVQLVLWARNRRKDDAEAGLTVDQRWQKWADQLEDRVKKLEDERETLLERVKGLMAEVDHYRRVARAMARHVLRLRDALAATGTDVPAMPTDIEDALTVIDLPNT